MTSSSSTWPTQAPHLSATEQAFAPIIYQTAMGVPGSTLPADPIQAQPSYAAALRAFQALPEIRVMFDNGAGGPRPGMPYRAFEHSFARFPVPGTHAVSWYLGAGGRLSAGAAPRAASCSGSPGSPARGRRRTSPATPSGGTNGLWTETPPYQWTPEPGRDGPVLCVARR